MEMVNSHSRAYADADRMICYVDPMRTEVHSKTTNKTTQTTKMATQITNTCLKIGTRLVVLNI